jgi:iron(III) transport system substrate-binding protein
MSFSRRTFLAAAAAVAGAGVTGCGGGSGGGQAGGGAIPSLAADTTAAFGGAEIAGVIDDLYQQAKAAGETQIVLYGAVAQAKKPVFDTFTRRFPEIKVVPQQLFGPQLVSRISQEAASGKHVADICATGSTTTLLFHQRGYFDGWSPANAGQVEPTYVGPDQAFLADSLSPFTIIYNTQRVPQDTAPKGWRDLLDPKYRGKIVISDPAVSGPSVDIFAHLIYGGRFTADYVRQFATQQPQISPSPAVFESMVATGARWIGFPDTYLAAAQAKAKGAPIGIVFPMNDGSYLAPTYAGLLEGAPHATAAKLLITWELTPEGIAALAANNTYSPVRGAKPPAGLPPLGQLDRLKVIPLDQAQREIDEQLALDKQIFGL